MSKLRPAETLEEALHNLPSSESEEPKLIEVAINFAGGGKVAIKEYGKIVSDYHASLSRKFSIPVNYSDAEAKEFQHQELLNLREELEPILQKEFDDRIEQVDWS